MMTKPKKLAVINDLSGYGRCALSVSLPVISALGVQACPIPTAILSNHTGFPGEYKYDFTDHMKPYIEAWEQLKLNFDGIMTGYMNYDEQVKTAAHFIEKFKKSGTLVFVDPAMADHGRLYRGFTLEYAGYIKERLISQATIIKPNLTEACILTGVEYETITDLMREHTMRRLKAKLIDMVNILKSYGPKKVVITGIERNGRIINVIADGDNISFLNTKKAGENRPGTGDIFSAVLPSSVLQGMSLERSVKKASEFISSCIAISEEAKVPVNEGVIFEKILDKLACTSYSK